MVMSRSDRVGAERASGRDMALAGSNQVIELVYELLDAHNDTAELASASAADLCWEAHLDYLRRLQRKGRAMLAHASAER